MSVCVCVCVSVSLVCNTHACMHGCIHSIRGQMVDNLQY